MSRRKSRSLCALFAVCALFPLTGHTCLAGQAKDPVAQAIADGDLYQSRRKYELALEAYRKADKLSHHASPDALLKIAVIEKKAGLLSDALNDAKKAIAAARDNKPLEIKARLMRANLLTAMANKPTDNKLKEAESELRAAITLDPNQPVSHLNLGLVLLKQERDPDGLAELKTYLQFPNADPSMSAEVRRILVNPMRARAPFVPDFAFTTHENQEVSNASLRGKVVLLDFWGTWCPPCRESVPLLKNIQKKYTGKPFQLISISSDDEEDVWKTFIAAQHMDWSEYLDSSRTLLDAFKVESFPTYIVADKDGVIRFRQSGLSSETQAELEEAINKALKKESNPALARAAAAGDAVPEDSEKDASAAKVAATPSHRDSTPATNASLAPATGSTSSASSGTPSNVFMNARLGLRYTFPDGWTAAKEETLRSTNERVEAGMKAALVKQGAQAADNTKILPSNFIFYASQRGDGSPERPSLSSISIRAVPAKLDTVDEEQFRNAMDRLAAATQLTPLAPAMSFDVKKHKFMRADFERIIGGLHYFQTYAQTVAGEYLLRIQIIAETPEQLRKIADTLQTMEIE